MDVDGRIGFEKIQRDLSVQTLKDLQGNRIIFFKRYPDLIEQPGFLPPQPLVIPSQHLKLLALGGIGLKSAQMSMIGPQKLRQHISIKTIALRWTHAKPIPSPIQGLGVDRIDHHTVIQKKIHNPAFRLLDRCPKLNSLTAALLKPPSELSQPVSGLLDFQLSYFSSTLITHIQLVALIRPIHSQIISRQSLILLFCLLPIPRAVNGKFALYRSSQGRLSIEPLAPFFCWSGQSRRDPRWDRGRKVLSQQALEIGFT